MSLLRQLKDIQVQADRLKESGTELEDFYTFGKYADELKQHLLLTNTDDFIIKLAKEIPDLNEESLGKPEDAIGILALIAGYFTASFFLKNQRMKRTGLEISETTKGKCASIEFILKNKE